MASAPDEAVRKKPLRLFKPICELYVPQCTNDMNRGLTPMTRFFPLLFALTCLITTLSAPVNASTSRTPAVAQRGPAPPDVQIEQTIRTKLAKSKIGKDGFRFRVQHGIVTWEGSTNVIQHKGSATRMARTAGATQVVNNIQISSSAKAKAAANLKKAYVQQ